MSELRSVLLSATQDTDLRFEKEREFVEFLANPKYIMHLCNEGYFKDQAFLNYITYLQYWRKPEYIPHIKYVLVSFIVIICSHVHSLFFLENLQHESFRDAFKYQKNVDAMHDNQYYHWKWNRLNRALETQDALHKN